MGRDDGAVQSPPERHPRCSDDEDSDAAPPPVPPGVSLRSLPDPPSDQVDALSVGGDRRCLSTPPSPPVGGRGKKKLSLSPL